MKYAVVVNYNGVAYKVYTADTYKGAAAIRQSVIDDLRTDKIDVSIHELDLV